MGRRMAGARSLWRANGMQEDQIGKPVFAIGGAIESEASDAFDGMFSLLSHPMTIDDAMKNAKSLLFAVAFQLAKTIKKLNPKN